MKVFQNRTEAAQVLKAFGHDVGATIALKCQLGKVIRDNLRYAVVDEVMTSKRAKELMLKESDGLNTIAAALEVELTAFVRKWCDDAVRDDRFTK